MFNMEMERQNLICSTESSDVSFQSSGRTCVFSYAGACYKVCIWWSRKNMLCASQHHFLIFTCWL